VTCPPGRLAYPAPTFCHSQGFYCHSHVSYFAMARVRPIMVQLSGLFAMATLMSRILPQINEIEHEATVRKPEISRSEATK
jgi:hypothetical protein